MLNITIDLNKEIVILEPEGTLTEEDFSLASSRVDKFIEELGEIKGLIVYSKDFPSWESFSALVSHLKFVRNHHEKIEKLAFVTDSSLVDFLEPMAKHFVHPEIKEFDYDELEEAKLWIEKEAKLTHGLSMAIKKTDKETFFLSFKAMGTLTHEDYLKIIPILDTRLAEVKEPKMNVFIDISELEGWEARAAWDDFKIGVKYDFNFEKIALYGENKLVDFGMKVSSWFISGEVKKFDSKEEALAWINA
ncbi:MAG: STAS/SEC14 domain-containing protein [uncultured Sulfurovum sp.]|uniref:STAS/SEC14 domain-containing protein n=1 Tax=uncultured Sulfurovum sp. TaxID=269237 RepID=A0A6S6T5X5_9BACT|nr:MAG: STAS/SEC14 domain-containing protein [uncultured Sulfurovum sp.]